MPVADLELDTEIFTGPFDLLLTLILREEVDLLEVDLADVVLGYLEYSRRVASSTSKPTTEFLVLIAALLELKSRLMLPRDEEDLIELLLVARMLDAHRYRAAAGHFADLLRAEAGVPFRQAPVPSRLRHTDADLDAVYAPDRLGAAIGTLLAEPEKVDVHATSRSRRSRSPSGSPTCAVCSGADAGRSPSRRRSTAPTA